MTALTEAQIAMRAKWTAALRSGAYRQTTSTLRNPDTGGYCCLGVLCDLSGQGEWSGDEYVVGKEKHWGTARGLVRPLVGEMAIGEGKYDGQWVPTLAEQNDYGTTFPDIADLIDADTAARVSRQLDASGQEA